MQDFTGLEVITLVNMTQLINKWSHNYYVYELYAYYSTVPTPNVIVTAPNTQIVGQSLTLECSVTTVRSITSRVDIIWRRDGTEVERMEGVSDSSTTGNMVMYTDTYSISQLNTTDDGREYQCEVVINTSPLVMATGSVTLDVTGEHSAIAKLISKILFPHSSYSNCHPITTWSHTKSYSG